MQSFSDYIASAPKPHVSKLYRRDNPDAGLVSGTKVGAAVLARALDMDRVDEVLAALEPEGRRLLLAIYASEERGMLESELVRGCDGGVATAGYWLALLEFELLVLRRDGEHRSYHGFREFASTLLPRLLEEFAPVAEPPAQTAWITNASHGASHICHFLARAARGDLRLTQTGELHRKSLQDLARGFGTGQMLSAAVAEEEAVFLFRFAADCDLLVDDGGLLRLSPLAAEWLEDGGEELARRLRDWWLRRRSRGLSRLLDALAGLAVAPGGVAGGLSGLAGDGADAALAEAAPTRAVAGLTPVFAVYEGWDKARAKPSSDLTTWENLPRLLRELWLVGGAEFAMSRGRIRYVRVLTPAERAAHAGSSTEAARGLPNFEALVPASIPLNRLFQIELLAVRENDERVTRYRFTKDSVLAGLRSGLGTDMLEELAGWLGFEVPARRVLAEWAASYASTVFREVFMLRVRDAGRFTDLEAFPQFMDLVTETIPGYGFVMPRSAREQACELLRVFDLVPGDEVEAAPAAAGRRPVTGEAADAAWVLPVFAHGEVVYRHVAPVRREDPIERERERGTREETPAQRLRSLENAIASQRSVEFNYGSGTVRLKVQPLHVLRNRDPMKLIAVDMASGHRNEYALDQMLAVRVGEMA